MAFRDRKFKRHRQKLVEKLRDKGIQDENVLRAIESVPRHQMLDTIFENKAYKDTALPIGKGQTISQPYTVAKQTELLQLSKGEKVLEVGTGSGYQAAVLCEMGMQVYSIERHKELYERARSMLREMGYRPMLKLGDGTLGWSAYAPYDAIVVTAGAPVVPEKLTEQLAVGGRLVVPVGDDDKQIMVRIIRVGADNITEERFDAFKFVPLIGEEGWEE
ncbi:MAG: protein-L-isoaspartate(D-aspartate) O-methyltransferase [Bacteroidota bacterium]